LAPGQAPRPLVAAGTPPSPRHAASAIYDPARERMILYGGVTADPAAVGEVWELTLSGTPTWTQLTPTGGAPAARQSHSAVYDPASDAMIVFGGRNKSLWRNDVWRLSLRGPMRWTNITPAASGDQPAPRADHVAMLDPVQHRMYVFGGDPPDEQTWRLELSGAPAWSVEPTKGPVTETYTGLEPPSGATAIYDASRQRGIMFGGDFMYGYPGVWELKFSPSGAKWKELSPDGAIPDNRSLAASTYDPLRDRMLVFGGRLRSGAFLNDLLSLQWEGAPTPASSPLSLAPPWPNPSSGGVAITFAMPSAGHARVRLYDVHGRLVREVLNGDVPAGPHEVDWDHRTTTGTLAPAGIYFVELLAAGERRSKRIVATD
ncbi:MAG TPA: kelch repeat-containing protein, partial [Methylomirabilota bacterium]|nr:kelch repeat-containing protein [Methylomirabilota bacterium]